MREDDPRTDRHRPRPAAPDPRTARAARLNGPPPAPPRELALRPAAEMILLGVEGTYGASGDVYGGAHSLWELLLALGLGLPERDPAKPLSGVTCDFAQWVRADGSELGVGVVAEMTQEMIEEKDLATPSLL